MQKMIDEYFTPKTGVEVDISIMPDQNKLVLANSSGNATRLFRKLSPLLIYPDSVNCQTILNQVINRCCQMMV